MKLISSTEKSIFVFWGTGYFFNNLYKNQPVPFFYQR